MPAEVKVTERQWANEDEAQSEEEMALISRCSHSQKSSATMAQILSKSTFYPNITRRLTIDTGFTCLHFELSSPYFPL